MKNYIYPAFLISMTLAFAACKKDEPAPAAGEPPQTVNSLIHITYQVDQVPLIFDSICYTNAAGNQYEVQRMEYYLSNITLYAANGNVFQSSGIYYMNARKAGNNSIMLNDVPAGYYNKMTFNLGLDSVHNISYSLPATTENLNMAWPDAMGGGYHFMKWEGNYLVNSARRGFTIHLGGNSSLVFCEISSSFVINADHQDLTLAMDLNEWFKTPQTYDLNTDGYSIMGNRTAQRKIANNGINAFSIH